MSTENSRLTRAIQRIAREDPDLRRAIEATRPRGDQPGGTGVGESDGERDRICCDGSTSDNPNPGSETRDPDANAKDGLDPDDPADISDNLSGVVDCATGQPICFEGSDWIPPEGWDSPTDPLPDPTWVEGVKWVGGADDGTQRYFSTCGPARAYAIGSTPCGAHPNDPGCPGGGFGVVGNWESCDDAPVTYRYYWGEVGCKSSDPDDICPDEAPTLEAWPEDGCVNLAIKGGKLVGSKYDPENDGSWSKPRDEVELCDDFGNSFNLAPAANGGWKTISATSGEDGFLYDSNGRQIARISGSEYSDPRI